MQSTIGESFHSWDDTDKPCVLIPIRHVRFSTIDVSGFNSRSFDNTEPPTVEEIIRDFMHRNTTPKTRTVDELSRDIFHDGLCSGSPDKHRAIHCSDGFGKSFATFRANSMVGYYCLPNTIVMAFDDCDIEIKPRLGQDNRYRLYDAQLVLNPRQKNNHSIKLAEPRSPERQSYQQFKDTVEDFLAPIGQGYSPSSF